MATQLQNGKQQFLDSDGNPLADGLVYMYIPSTSTPKDTWQNEGQTILNDNPIELDAGGYAVIWGSGRYRQLVLNSDGDTIWDQITIDAVVAVEENLTVTTDMIDDNAITFAKMQDISNNVVLGRQASGAGEVEELPIGLANDDIVQWSSAQGLTFGAGTAAAPTVNFQGDTTTGLYRSGAGVVNFATAGVQSFRCSTHFGLGDFTGGVGSADLVRMADTFTFQCASTGSSIMSRRSADGAVLTFRRDATGVGSISVSTTATAYNTSSDYRLKKNIDDIENPSAKLLSLKPCEFDWKVNGQRTMGFIAHEVAAVVPDAVMGIKDGEEMQQMDASKLIPLLTAALQDALKRIEILENQES